MGPEGRPAVGGYRVPRPLFTRDEIAYVMRHQGGRASRERAGLRRLVWRQEWLGWKRKGWTVPRIAERYGVSQRTVLRALGVEAREQQPVEERAYYKAKVKFVRLMIRRLARGWFPGVMTYQGLAPFLGCRTTVTVQKWVKRSGQRERVWAIFQARRRAKWDAEQLARVKALGAELGWSPTEREADWDGVNTERLRKHLRKNWSEVLEMAGLPRNKVGRAPGPAKQYPVTTLQRWGFL